MSGGRGWKFILLGMASCWAAAAMPRDCLASTLVMRDGSKWCGEILREGPDAIVLRVVEANGQLREVSFPPAEVAALWRPVDAARLERLDPSRSHEYLAYAEELAMQREDPEARALARRLLVIAAHASPAELGRAAMLGLAAVSDSPGEQAAARAMAFLLDPDRDQRLLSLGAAEAAVAARQQAAAVRAVILTRQGQPDQALACLANDESCAQLASLGRVLTWADLRELASRRCVHCRFGAVACLACGGSGVLDEGRQCLACHESPGHVLCPECAGDIGRLPRDELRRLVVAELRLTHGAVEQAPTRGWGAAHRLARDEPVAVLSLSSFAGVDPRACWYRQGQWTAEAVRTPRLWTAASGSRLHLAVDRPADYSPST